MLYFKKILLCNALLLITILLSGQINDSIVKPIDKLMFEKDNYQLVYDGFYDMNGSAHSLFTVSKLFGRGIDAITCRKDQLSGFSYCLGKEYWAGRFLLDGVNMIFTTWISTIQHECMGHGFRVRESGFPVKKYVINPGMFGDAYIVFDKEKLPYYAQLLEDVAGSESNLIMSREAYRQSLLYDYFRHYTFYSFALKTDLLMYILGTPKVGSSGWYSYQGGGWDICLYTKEFKSKTNLSEKEIMKRAKNGVIWGFADPSFLLSIFNYTRDYIIRGRVQVKIPMITLSHFSFLPYTDFHLTPFGFEYYLGLYLKYKRTLYESYYRWANGNIDGSSNGFGLNILNLLNYKRIRLDSGIDFWKQAFNLLHYEINDSKYYKDVLSGKIYVKSYYQLNSFFSCNAQVSYKGEGFIAGYPIKSGFNGKFGVNIFF